MSTFESFLAGDRLDDVVLFLNESVLEEDSRLRNVGVETDDGVRLVLDGETGRSAFQAGTGMDAMEFAGNAMGTEGEIARSLDAGACPLAPERPEEDHAVEFVFAFAEGENEEVGGLYAEGDVIHAYAHCRCGANYSHKWVVGTRT